MSKILWSSRVFVPLTLQWHHNERDGVSCHQPHHCLLNYLFRLRSKKTSELRVTGLWAGNSPVTGEFPAQMASDAENVSIWWRHHSMIFSHGIWLKLKCEKHKKRIPKTRCTHIQRFYAKKLHFMGHRFIQNNIRNFTSSPISMNNVSLILHLLLW